MNFINKLKIKRESTIKQAFEKLEQTGIGILLIIKDDNSLDRTITDGDLRRLLLKGVSTSTDLTILPDIQSKVLTKPFLHSEALKIMNEESIDHLPVVNEAGIVSEIVHRRDIDQQILLSSPHLGVAERRFVEEAFDSNWIAPLGPNVDAFEKDLTKLVGTNEAAAVSSGTAAIHLGLKVLGVGEGDIVFCSSLTFAASAFPIMYQGATPIFIDSHFSSWNMCPKALEIAFENAKREGKIPKAVIVVNLFGQSADMDPIIALCEEYSVPILEDAAESLGAKYKKKSSGTFGKVGVFSFNGNKIITTSGGGMLISEEAELIEKAKFYATQARDFSPHYEHSEVGFNYRMSNILAGIGRGQLKVLGERVRARRRIFDYYHEKLNKFEFIEWMPEPDWSYSNRWLTAFRFTKNFKFDAREVIIKLNKEMIEARHVWKPMHLQPIFSTHKFFSAEETPVSNVLFENGVCLPSGSNMSDKQLERVIKTTIKILEGLGD